MLLSCEKPGHILNYNKARSEVFYEAFEMLQ